MYICIYVLFIKEPKVSLGRWFGEWFERITLMNIPGSFLYFSAGTVIDKDDKDNDCHGNDGLFQMLLQQTARDFQEIENTKRWRLCG